MYRPFFFFDPTYILVILGLVLSGLASLYVNTTFSRYNRVKSKNNITGTQAASFILQDSGIDHVTIRAISGHLSDNYNSADKTLNLSESTAQATSVAAIGVAAHECGHAIQDQVAYFPLRLRHMIVPVANIGSTISFPLIFIGVIMGMNQTLIYLGIFAFSLALIFQLVTLPVEFNASLRAIRILSEGNLLTEEEIPMVKKVLFAAALTYVAAALSTFLQLLRLILLYGNRRDD